MGDLISIIIPTYNRSKLIERSLKSIEQQTIKNYEIIDAIEASGNIAVILKIYYTDQNDLENKVDIWIHENNNGISNTINLHEFKTFFTKEYHLEFTSQ